MCKFTILNVKTYYILLLYYISSTYFSRGLLWLPQISQNQLPLHSVYKREVSTSWSLWTWTGCCLGSKQLRQIWKSAHVWQWYEHASAVPTFLHTWHFQCPPWFSWSCLFASLNKSGCWWAKVFSSIWAHEAQRSKEQIVQWNGNWTALLVALQWSHFQWPANAW